MSDREPFAAMGFLHSGTADSHSILARMLVLAFLMTAATRAGLTMLVDYAADLGLEKTNYEGLPVVSSAGVVLAAAAAQAYLAAAIWIPAQRSLALSFALVSAVSGLLGYLDDRFGSRSVGGLRGHFGELLRGRFTTGAAKALLLPPAALLTARVVLQQPFVDALLTAALVALFANTLNLLDVRPARAATAWFAGAGFVLTIALWARTCYWPVALLLGPVAIYLPDDARRRVMLGDVGANFLGAVLGLQFGTAAPLPVRLVVLALLVGVQAFSESHSLNAVVETRAWLRWLDYFAERYRS